MFADTGILSLQQRRNIQAKIFFKSILRPDVSFSTGTTTTFILESKEILSRLRDARRLPTTACRTKKVPVVHKLCLGKLPVKSVQHPIFYTLCIVIPFIDSLYSPYLVLYVYFSIACLYLYMYTLFGSTTARLK